MGGELGVDVGPDTADDLDRGARGARRRGGRSSSPTSRSGRGCRSRSSRASRRTWCATWRSRGARHRRVAQEKFAELDLRRPSVRPAVPDRGDAQGLHARSGPRLPREHLRRRPRATLRRRRLRRRGDGSAIRKAFEPWAGRRGVDAAGATGRAIRRLRADRSRRRAAVDRHARPAGCPIRRHADWVALEVTDSLLGGSFASRITANIREQKGYTYSPNSSITSHPGEAQLGRNGRRDDQRDRAVASRRSFSRSIGCGRRRRPAAELQGIKNNLAGIFVVQNASRGRRHRPARVRGSARPRRPVSGELREARHGGHARRGAADRQRYLTPDKMTLVVVGDTKTVQEQVAPME